MDIDTTPWVDGPTDEELREASVEAMMEPLERELRQLKRKIVLLVAARTLFHGAVLAAAIKYLVGW